MGALQLARSVNDAEFSSRILQAGIDTALNLAK
jgi:hypothetical protein